MLLLASLLTMSLTSPTNAQDAPTPPGLLMIIMIDDSSTNDPKPNAGGRNNTLTAGLVNPNLLKRIDTDRNNYRTEAAIDVIRLLQSDPITTHQVAVLRFANVSVDQAWLGGNAQDPAQRLTPIGGGSSPNAESLITAVRTRNLNNITVGPGQLDEAMVEVRDFLQNSAYAAHQGLKPVILLITDDVPIDGAISNSPFGNSSSWQTNLAKFQDPLRELTNPTGYQPYPTDRPCALPSGGATFAVFAMGAANWVNRDGTTDKTPDTVDANISTEYYPALVSSVGGLDTLDGGVAPLAYRIDPTFADETGNTLRDGLQDAVLRLHRAVRCATPIDVQPTPNPPPDQRGFSFSISAFYQTTRLTLTTPSGSGITFRNPAGETVQLAEIAALTYGDELRRHYRLLDTDAAWSVGEWSITITGANTADLYAEADISLAGTDSSISGELTGLKPRTRNNYLISVSKNGQPVISDPLLADPALSVTLFQSNRPSQELAVTHLETGYEVVIEETMAESSGDYTLRPTLNLKTRDGTLLTSAVAALTFPDVALNYDSGFTMEIGSSLDRTIWDCDDGDNTQNFSVITKQSSEGGNPESLGSFTQVDVYYPMPDLTLEPTPLAGLRWRYEKESLEGAIEFDTAIPCNSLNPGPNQSMLVVARFPNNSIATAQVNFSLPIPTAKPAETLPPTLTPMPTPTPTPPRPAPIQDISNRVLAPPLSYLIVGILGVITIGAMYGGFNRWMSQHLPLHHVTILAPQADKNRPLLPRWKRLPPMRYIPYLQSSAIQHGDSLIFTVRAGDDGQIVIRAGSSPLNINGESVPPNTEVSTNRATITIRYNHISDDAQTNNELKWRLFNHNKGVS